MNKKSLGFDRVNEVVKSAHKGQLGVYLVAVVSCDSKFLASGRSYLGRVFKVTRVDNARVGCTYQGMVSPKMADGETFVPTAPKGMFWLDYPFFKQGIKSGKKFLSLCYRPSDERTKFVSEYIIDGHKATDAEVALMEQYMSKSSRNMSRTQAAVGVSVEDETRVVQYDVNDIAYIGFSKDDAIDEFEGVF